MRFLPLIMLVLVGASSSASAAVLWAETMRSNKPQVHWALGADQNEVIAAMQSHVGVSFQITQICRNNGYFSYVGSINDSIHGVSCGHETSMAAVYAARQQCELSHGHCDLERVGYDSGESLVKDSTSRLPQTLTGTTNGAGNSPLPMGNIVEK